MGGIFGSVILGSVQALRASRTQLATLPDNRPSWFRAACLGGIGLTLVWYVFRCVTMPVMATDFLAVWGLKGRLIFSTASIPHRLFDDPAMGWSHPEYPLLLPLGFASLASLAGEWSPTLFTLVYAVCCLATILLIYGWICRTVGPDAGAAAALLTACCVSLYSSSNVYMAEVPLAFAMVLLVSALPAPTHERCGSQILRFFIAALLCSCIKREGSLFVLAVLLSTAVGQGRRSAGGRLTLWLAAAGPVALQALAFRAAGGPLSGRDVDFSLVWPHPQFGELAGRFRLAGVHLSHQLLPVVPAIALIVILLAQTARGKHDWLWVPLSIQAGFYLAAAEICRYGPVWQMDSVFPRIFSALFPILACAIGARLPGETERAAALPRMPDGHRLARNPLPIDLGSELRDRRL